ncbi:hypothetical protein HDU87_007190 [Geranomyces variabilis]|uniref:Uncharacterized protein n=1 Tax=Geranomyces variabilis TaxID=109894 RepID=A0AAD5TE42_9FUNG|nr:hypothetical protein HDU87_007190 [Geranomyces variabilis]
MPLLTNILLGVLGGQLLTRAVYDHIWYPFFFNTDPATLKAKVTASQRQESMNFYRHIAHQPAYFNYVIYGATFLILLSLVGQTVVAARNRVSNLLALVSFSSAVGIYITLVHPLISSLVAARGPHRMKADAEARSLSDLAFWQACIAAAWFVTLILQTGVSENEDAAARVSSSSSSSLAKKVAAGKKE